MLELYQVRDLGKVPRETIDEANRIIREFGHELITSVHELMLTQFAHKSVKSKIMKMFSQVKYQLN